MEYNHTPLPAICGQAVHVVCWFYLIVGAFAAQPWCDNDTSFWYYFQVVYADPIFLKKEKEIIGLI